ncbi:MAG: hypothetical protein CVU64_03220 [Deltaproteobacteria bacterium HGW-Deltaproteobacteria-21]|nr:MAG: hypothetical protein CVU64_03220 [Deltaproteobacteria bacterium HGW-Deltaproteobacteria-21]
MDERTFETILARYPELIESGLKIKGRQVSLYGRRMDLLFEDAFQRKLIIELKVGPIKDQHIGQVLSYEGMLLSADDPTIRVMLVGNRVPPNIRRALDHHGIAWMEISVASLLKYLRKRSDEEMLSRFPPEELDSIEQRERQTASERPKATGAHDPEKSRELSPTLLPRGTIVGETPRREFRRKFWLDLLIYLKSKGRVWAEAKGTTKDPGVLPFSVGKADAYVTVCYARGSRIRVEIIAPRDKDRELIRRLKAHKLEIEEQFPGENVEWEATEGLSVSRVAVCHSYEQGQLSDHSPERAALFEWIDSNLERFIVLAKKYI